jgi:putative ABC transport system permease protein
MAQSPIAGGMLLVRTTGDPLRAAGMARAAVAALDPRVPVDKVRTLDAVRDSAVTGWRVVTALLGMFALLALGITATGVGSVLAFSVGQRTTEFGVRMALGATRGPVVRQVMGQGLALTAAGLVLGLAGATAFGRVMSAMLFGVSPADPVTLAGVTAVLFVAAAAACYLPARRATAVDPLTALRHS